MSVKKINISGNEYDIKDANAQAMISDEFDSGTSYTTGDYCIYENVLYKFTSDKSAGAWDSGKVAATNIDTELSSLNSRMDSKANYIVVSDPSVPGDPIQAIKNKWANIPEGECFCKISVGSLYCALIQKINNGEFGGALIIGYSFSEPQYIVRANGNWI